VRYLITPRWQVCRAEPAAEPQRDFAHKGASCGPLLIKPKAQRNLPQKDSRAEGVSSPRAFSYFQV
jgi:hypothetical protein